MTKPIGKTNGTHNCLLKNFKQFILTSLIPFSNNTTWVTLTLMI